jgi:multidrug transporter EmrE-like cation transporter
MNIGKHLIPLYYGSYLAIVDVFALGILKSINLGKLAKSFIVIPTLMYAIQPHVFLASMKFESMTVTNLLWDVISDILVTASGIFYFGEKLSQMKMMGIGFAIVAIVFMSWPDDT